MYYDILDKNRKDILPLLKAFKNDFYLAGGTALALQIGHRDSIDFDFFCPSDLDTDKLFSQIKDALAGHDIVKVQEEKNTLTVIIDGDIKISFFTYEYPLLEKLIEEENLNIAGLKDIACMKLSAILGRASNKDYIDLYFILQSLDLPQLLEAARKKFSDIDTNLILKSLVYFEDVEMEDILFVSKKDIDFEAVKKFLISEVKKI